MQQVSKRFGHAVAVENVTLNITKGDSVALLGPNGAGKTTTIAMLLGLTAPTAGSVKLFAKNPSHPDVKVRIGAMLQDVSVPDRLTVKEIIQMFCDFYPRPLPVKQLLTLSGLDAYGNKIASSLSGGLKRRLQFAIALAGDPDLLFLDEPTVGMDVESRHAFWQVIQSLIERKKTVLLTTHDLQEAEILTKRILVMQKGKLIADGTAEQIKHSFSNRFVSFKVASMEEYERQLSLWPEVSSLQRKDDRLLLMTESPDEVVRKLVDKEIPFREIEVKDSGLEDAFIRITNQSNREGADS
jgi:ABC-2 type transport system ATP-binding protein